MISIFFLILFISINGIISSNSSTTRLLIIPTCERQTSKLFQIPIDRSDDEFERSEEYFFSLVSVSNSGESYFYFSPLSSSSSILSFCQDQQNTWYSSNGFSILYSSSSHWFATNIEKKKHSSSSFFDHNAVLSALDQSSSSTRRNLIKLMSSTNENQTDHSLISTTTTTLSTFTNRTLSMTPNSERENSTFNFTLFMYCSIAGIVTLIVFYLIVKLCKRDEGTYKIDESKNFPGKSPDKQSDKLGCIGKIPSSSQHRKKILSIHEEQLETSKEWYV